MHGTLERRELFRNRVYYGGMLAFNGRNSTLCCIVRDFTELGARIEFDGSPILPDQVDFDVERKGLSCQARLAWRDRNQAGLQFSELRNANAPVPLAWARRLRASERKNKLLRQHVAKLRSEY